MSKPYVHHLYCHLVWATWNRMPLITAEIEKPLHAAIAVKCRELGAEPIAIGGVNDHIHLLVRFPSSIALAKLVQEVKGASSHLVTHLLKPGEFFKWQCAYGALTVSQSAVLRVARYILNQKKHHADGTLQTDWECMEEPGH